MRISRGFLSFLLNSVGARGGFCIEVLGTVSEKTKGGLIGPLLDGGDAPFQKKSV
jgi:hypothetical protein